MGVVVNESDCVGVGVGVVPPLKVGVLVGVGVGVDVTQKHEPESRTDEIPIVSTKSLQQSFITFEPTLNPLYTTSSPQHVKPVMEFIGFVT